MVLLAYWSTMALADMVWGEAPRKNQTLIVKDPATEGPVRLVMPGRVGDTVYCDGWNLGVLPLDTILAGGLHEFRVEGPTGTAAVAIDVTPSKHQTVELDLTPPPAPAQPAAPAATISRPGT